MNIWNFPGAARCIDEICKELRSGNNVVVRFPFNIPNGFDIAISNDISKFKTIRSIDVSSSPIALLAKEFVNQPEDIKSIRSLILDEGFHNYLIRLNILSIKYWDEWQEFLVEFARLNRTIPRDTNSQFLVSINKNFIQKPLSEVGLKYIDASSFFDEFDSMSYTSGLLQRKKDPNVINDLFVYTVTFVAQGDINLIDILTTSDPKDILDHNRLANKVLEARGCAEGQLHTQSNESLPKVNCRGRDQHPNDGYYTIIEKSLVRAQQTVLFPWIGVQLNYIVDRYREEIKRLIREVKPEITDPTKMEVSHLCDLYKHRNSTPKVRKSLRVLRDARNQLAHNSVLKYREINKLVTIIERNGT